LAKEIQNILYDYVFNNYFEENDEQTHENGSGI
jgi:hypothetical protein